MNALVELINRLRSQGFSYEKIKGKLEKMGNSSEDIDSAIVEYVKEMCGCEPSLSPPP